MTNIKSKILVLLLTLAVALLCVACDVESVQPKTFDVTVWSAVNSARVLQDDDTAKSMGAEGKISFNTFRGDVESAQFFFASEKDVSSFSFEMCDVVSETGARLNANLFEVLVQKYIEVSVPSSQKAFIGFYPDALVPIRNYIAKRENRVKKGNNQGLWINLTVPTDAKPGTYTGVAKLTVDSEEIDVPVSVKIFNIKMPSEIHTVSSYYLELSMIGKDTSAQVDELIEIYYDFFVKKRANLRDIPGYSINKYFDAATFANDIVEYAQNPMVSAYALPYKGNSNGIVDGEYCYDVLYQLALKNKSLLDRGYDIDLFKKAHYYLGALIDEPTPAKYENVRACDLAIHQAKLRVAETGVLDAYPEVKNSLLSLRHVVTAQINRDLYGTDEVGGIQTWCPLLSCFTSEAQRQLAQDRINSTDRIGGEDVWWYTCINPKNPYASYQTDEDLLVARLKSWMQYDYNIHGFLYWSVNNWNRYYQGQYMSTDVWTDPRSWEEANGDGRLVYPGSKYGVKGPISTLRLENIRESNEDYELLWLFEQTINEINATYSKSYDSDKILNSFYDRLYTNLFVNSDVTPDDFDTVRIELMQLLDDMINIPVGAISVLDELSASL